MASGGTVPDLHESLYGSAVDCRTDRLFAQPPLPHAGMDVSDPAGPVRNGKGARLLPRTGISHAHRHGRDAGERWLGRCRDCRGSPLGVFFTLPLVECMLVLRWSTRFRWSAEKICLEEQRRSARRDRLGRSGQDRCWDSGFVAPGTAAQVGILVGNYGEQGAIEILGPAYHLPPPISGTNSAWLRGYPTPPPRH